MSILAAFCYLSQLFDRDVIFSNHSERWLDIFLLNSEGLKPFLAYLCYFSCLYTTV